MNNLQETFDTIFPDDMHRSWFKYNDHCYQYWKNGEWVLDKPTDNVYFKLICDYNKEENIELFWVGLYYKGNEEPLIYKTFDFVADTIHSSDYLLEGSRSTVERS